MSTITNLIFKLLKWLIVKSNDEDLIIDICEELLELDYTDKFIIGRFNCPICGDPFYPGEWNCTCFNEKEQDQWLYFIESIMYERNGYNFFSYIGENNE